MKILLLLSLCVAYVCADSTSLKKFVPRNQLFTAEVYKEVLKTHHGNFMVSPLSLEIIMALVTAGAKESTAAELERGLRLPENQDETNRIFSELIPTLRSNDQYNLSTANRIFANEEFTIKDEYRKLASNVYHAGIENLNFSNSQNAANLINGWVEQQTNHKIRNIVDPSSLSNDVKLLLVNTLYFNANWSSQFDPIRTRKQLFHVDGKKTVDVDMMEIVETVNYYECNDLDAQFVELPYVGEQISMVIVLPKKRDGLAGLEDRMFDVIAHTKFNQERVKVQIPKFSTETSIEMIPILENLGIQQAFTTRADLSGIGKGSLAISDILQKTFINVTESGTEAAAATTVTIQWTKPSAPLPEPIVFNTDHPFTYIIRTTKGIPLFIGRFNGKK